MPSASDSTADWGRRWQQSWDRLEERYVPDRESRIAFLVELVQAVVGLVPTVVDLGCGTGTVSLRVLERLPGAGVVAVDVDPVLLAIASATFAGDDRVRIVTADLRDPGWTNGLLGAQVDAVVTATALHWLAETVVRRVYRDLAGLIRPGGVFAHTELMPLADLPVISTGLERLKRDRRAGLADEGRSGWDAWWDLAAADPALRAAVAQRRAVFGANYPTEEFSPPAGWHVATLKEAGFREAGVVWRSGQSAVVAALR